MPQLHVLLDQTAYGALQVAEPHQQVCCHLFELLDVGAIFDGLLIDGQREVPLHAALKWTHGCNVFPPIVIKNHWNAVLHGSFLFL
jgi:hypothetical protein